MLAVIFEVIPTAKGREEYFALAADLKKHLSEMPGFISIERFQSLVDANKILSLSFWENEEAIAQWRNLEKHRSAQGKGRNVLFESYRIRVARIARDYTLDDRQDAPDDSKAVHDELIE